MIVGVVKESFPGERGIDGGGLAHQTMQAGRECQAHQGVAIRNTDIAPHHRIAGCNTSKIPESSGSKTKNLVVIV